MNVSLASLSCFASIQSALAEPVFPGKILIWLLFMLSIVSWVMIVSKLLQLRRIRRADRDFGKQLRGSRSTLELFEEGWRDEHSLHYLIYVAGARETLFQFLGTRNPMEGLQERIEEKKPLDGRQSQMVGGAFLAGYRLAIHRLGAGVVGLGFIAAAGMILGAIGGTYTLMKGFDALAPGESLPGTVMGSVLGFVLIGLLVSGPAILGKIGFQATTGRMKGEAKKFRDDIKRLFERKFASVGGEVELGRSSDDDGPGSVESEGARKKYHSIRDRILGAGSDAGDDESFRINPIARQAAELGN